MTIKDWEEYVFKKYKAKKIENFLKLKRYLTNPLHYTHNFTPEEITETEITNDEYYAAYVFDEDIIAGRKTKSLCDTCWQKLIVFIASKDKQTISDYSINVAGGLNDAESRDFYRDIDPLSNREFNTI